MQISVVILTKNAGKHIAACLDSVKWADEILVVDCGSADGTVEIARLAGARVVYNSWPGFAAQRNFALTLCSHEWVLMIDADERASAELAKDIKRALSSVDSDKISGYSIPRKNYFWGQWIRGTYPNRHFHLFRKSKASYRERAVHESIEVNGEIKLLNSPIIHYPFKDLAQFVDKMNLYSSLAAQDKLKQGNKFSIVKLLFRSMGAFLKFYVLKGSYRDGVPGLVYAVTNSFYVFLKYAKMYPENIDSC